MPVVDLNTIVGNPTGNQIRAAFKAINTAIGSEVVTDIHKIHNPRMNMPYHSSGSQLRNAFDQLNVYFGSELVDLNIIQNIQDGGQLRSAFEVLNAKVAIPPVLVSIAGWSGGVDCSGGDYVINFNRDVTFTSHLGVSFVNVTTAETATVVASATVSPSNQIVYTMTWVTPPAVDDIIEFRYDDIAGEYTDSPAGETLQTFTGVDATTVQGYVEDGLTWAAETTNLQFLGNRVINSFVGPGFASLDLGFIPNVITAMMEISANLSITLGINIRGGEGASRLICRVRNDGATSTLVFTPVINDVNGSTLTLSGVNVDITTAKKLIIEDNGTNVKMYFEDQPTQSLTISSGLPPRIPFIGLNFQNSSTQSIDDVTATTASVANPLVPVITQELGIVNCASMTERVINGTFDIDGSNWLPLSSPTVTVTGGVLKLARSTTNNPKLYQAIDTVIGDTYVLKVVAGTSQNANINIRIGNTQSNGGIATHNLADLESYETTFVAEATTTFITMVAFNDSAISGDFAEYDSISVIKQ